MVSDVGCGEILIPCAPANDKGGVTTLQLTQEGGGVYMTLGEVGEWWRGEEGRVQV